MRRSGVLFSVQPDLRRSLNLVIMLSLDSVPGFHVDTDGSFRNPAVEAFGRRPFESADAKTRRRTSVLRSAAWRSH
jgi:hypothetical protein